MTLLSQLTFSANRRTAAAPSELRNRARALETINEQIELVKNPEAKATRLVGKQAERKRVERRNGGRMFWSDTLGWHAEFRFAGSLVDFSDNGRQFTTIDAGKERENLVRVFEVLRESVQNGELDAQLNSLAERRKRKSKAEPADEQQAELQTAEPEAPQLEKPRRSRGH